MRFSLQESTPTQVAGADLLIAYDKGIKAYGMSLCKDEDADRKETQRQIPNLFREAIVALQ